MGTNGSFHNLYLSCGDQAVLLSLSKLKASLFVVWALFIYFVYIF